MPAEITTQFNTGGAIGAREDLSDIINRIDPDDTPVYSRMKKGTRSAIQFDWQALILAMHQIQKDTHPSARKMNRSQ